MLKVDLDDRWWGYAGISFPFSLDSESDISLSPHQREVLASIHYDEYAVSVSEGYVALKDPTFYEASKLISLISHIESRVTDRFVNKALGQTLQGMELVNMLKSVAAIKKSFSELLGMLRMADENELQATFTLVDF